MFDKIFGIFFKKKEKLNEPYDDKENKEYILNDDYYDHPEPELMSDEEIDKMQHFENSEMDITEPDVVSTDSFKIGETQISAAELNNRMANHSIADSLIGPGFKVKKPGEVSPPRPPGPSLPPPSIPGAVGNNIPSRGVNIPVGVNNSTGSNIAVKTAIPKYIPHTTVLMVEDGYYVIAEIPGIDKTAVEVNFADRELLISGKYINYLEEIKNETRSRNPSGKKKDVIIDSKSNFIKDLKFEIKVPLTKSIDDASLSAKLDDGVLRVYLPFSSKSQKVSIQIGM